MLAKDDDIIVDISIYEDSNPNHLDYFCPECRNNAARHPSALQMPTGTSKRKILELERETFIAQKREVNHLCCGLDKPTIQALKCDFWQGACSLLETLSVALYELPGAKREQILKQELMCYFARKRHRLAQQVEQLRSQK